MGVLNEKRCKKLNNTYNSSIVKTTLHYILKHSEKEKYHKKPNKR